ncbi:MAG: glycine cleavage system protein GcvH [Candidatus Hodarchaeaceae archaeon]|nr:glycine cleavage system protein GcvH [Candidatus Hodarchaeaceae archaeon]
MNAGNYDVPEGLYYSREHEWVKLEGNLARVGVTDYAQSRLGDVVYVELPEVGKRVKQVAEAKGKEMELGAVESIKAISAIYSPLSGVVKEVNPALQERPELINTSPYAEGWICVLEPSAPEAELKQLMDAKAYAEYVKKLE